MEVVRRIRLLPGFLAFQFMRAVNKGLSPLEMWWSDGGGRPLIHPPIFIIGAPRSGSTLLYQVMVDYFDVGYLSNLHCALVGIPSLVERLINTPARRQPSNYGSMHGRAEGWLEPSECGEYWYRFFRRYPLHATIEDTPPLQRQQMRAALRALGDAFERPVLFKNLYCGLRLEPIIHAIPEAYFVVLHRNEVDVGHSLLEGRYRVHGTYERYWATVTPNMAQWQNRPPYEQVIEQCREIYAYIETYKQQVDGKHFVDIQYEEFCADTHAVLAQLHHFFAQNGLTLGRRYDVPKAFPMRRRVRIEEDLYHNMVVYANRPKGMTS